MIRKRFFIWNTLLAFSSQDTRVNKLIYRMMRCFSTVVMQPGLPKCVKAAEFFGKGGRSIDVCEWKFAFYTVIIGMAKLIEIGGTNDSPLSAA
jgi:hypothetical protein